MKTLAVFFGCILFGIAAAVIYAKETTVQPILEPIAELTQSLPEFSIAKAPSDSLIGSIATQSGTIEWQSRVATTPAQIAPLKIQQGEKLVTQNSGKISVMFANAGTILLSPQTDMDFVQTLPEDIVLSQNSGDSEILKNGSVPITIRTKNLLTQVNDGDVSISVNTIRPIVTITVATGSATVAYNDVNYYSNVYNILAGQSFIYNYTRQDGIVE